MNKTFSIKRFGNYLLWDINNAKNKYWISAAVIAALPIIYYLFFELIHRLASGEWGTQATSNRITCIIAAAIILLLSFPVKTYGGITDKKFGTSWILLPASPLEKWLSMMLITCLIAPVLILGSMMILDFLLGTVFPVSYGSPLVSMKSEELLKDTEILSPAFIFAAEWITSILTFTLGAICFKKSKIAKTILVLIGVGMVSGIIICLLAGKTNFTGEELMQSMGITDFDTAAKMLKRIIVIIYSAAFAILSSALYCRIRTIKK